ncbi:MAG: hypothetical protein JW940_19965 [Polyangiaceae bacterium]|nr:hypothetical protein [Polyangiaceae bacterium]
MRRSDWRDGENQKGETSELSKQHGIEVRKGNTSGTLTSDSFYCRIQ